MTIAPGTIVWRAATPRTGGTVLSEIAAFLLEAAGVPTEPIDRATLEDGLPAGSDTAVRLGAEDAWFSPVLADPRLRVLFVRRDFRDAAASYRRLTQARLDIVTGEIERWFSIHKGVRDLPPGNVLTLDYDSVLDIAGAVAAVAAFLDLSPDEGIMAAAIDRFDRASVAGRLAKAGDRVMAELDAQSGRAQSVGGFQVPLAYGGEVRLLDIPVDILTPETMDACQRGSVAELDLVLPESGTVTLAGNRDGTSLRIVRIGNADLGAFNVDHVRTRHDTPWQDAFSAAEAATIETLTAPMRRELGY